MARMLFYIATSLIPYRCYKKAVTCRILEGSWPVADPVAVVGRIPGGQPLQTLILALELQPRQFSRGKDLRTSSGRTVRGRKGSGRSYRLLLSLLALRPHRRTHLAGVPAEEPEVAVCKTCTAAHHLQLAEVG